MTSRHPWWSRRAALGQALIPLTLLALLALVGALTFHVRRAEQSHVATAESALREYAGFAAWQFSRDVDEHLTMLAHNALHHLDHLFRRPETRPTLPPAEVLLRPVDPGLCDIRQSAHFAFRIDYPDGVMTVVGDTAGVAVVDLRAAIAKRLRERSGVRARGNGVRLLVDTILGTRRSIAWGVVLGADSLPRAIYGVDGDAARIDRELKHVHGLRPLLPPSLVEGRPIEEIMTVRVTSADGGERFLVGPTGSAVLSSSVTTPPEAGALTTTVGIPLQAAEALLIGGMPTSRLPILWLMLAASVFLAGIALVQLRRGRELGRLRARFVANVSHELRTPLAQISMFSETLLLGRERTTDERQQFLNVIYREARRLSHLVESVLSFSHADAGPRRLRPERCDVAEEVRDAVRTFSALAAASSVELEAELEAGAWTMVEPGSLRQVIINLLDNAVKFGPAGQRVLVRVSRAAGEILITVDDEGPGIPAPQRRRVFEPFAQGDHAPGRSATATGAGIGLAVVAELVSAHGGRVWIADAPGGRGARLAVALLAIESPQAAGFAAEDASALRGSSPHPARPGARPVWQPTPQSAPASPGGAPASTLASIRTRQ